MCYWVGSGLEEDKERNVEARSKSVVIFQERGGIGPLKIVKRDVEQDSLETIVAVTNIETIHHFHTVNVILSSLSYVALYFAQTVHSDHLVKCFLNHFLSFVSGKLPFLRFPPNALNRPHLSFSCCFKT